MAKKIAIKKSSKPTKAFPRRRSRGGIKLPSREWMPWVIGLFIGVAGLLTLLLDDWASGWAMTSALASIFLVISMLLHLISRLPEVRMFRFTKARLKAMILFNRHREFRRVKTPPGRRHLRLAEILFSPKTVSLTFKPLIADWQFEYFEALKNNEPAWQLRLISLRYFWYYAKACGLSKIGRLFKAFATRSSS